MTQFRTVVYRRGEPASPGPRAPEGDDALAAESDDGASFAGDGEVTLDHEPGRRPRSWAIPSVVSALAAVGVYGYLGATRYSELRVGLIAVPLILGVGWALLGRLGQGRAFDLVGIARTGLALKLFAVAARYQVIYGSYNGVADQDAYHENGVRLAAGYRRLAFDTPALQKIPGTGFIRIVTGATYTVVGSDIVRGFIVFGIFGFIGSWLFYRALELAAPDAKLGRYALLIFLWPSVLFWSAAIGKDAWLLMGIGIVAYGAGRVLGKQRFGFPVMALGLYCVTMVRPHISVFLFVSFAPAYLMRRGGRFDVLGPGAKLIGGALVVLASMSIVTIAADYFEIDALSVSSIEETLQSTADQTDKGGSKFSPPNAFSPIGYPLAVVTVLVRPFPFEADNAQMLFTSLEGILLAAMLLRFTVPSLRRFKPLIRNRSYSVMALAYVAAFVFGFAAISNFGILARQRVQMLPFAFVLLCLPKLVSASAVSDRVEAGRARRRR